MGRFPWALGYSKQSSDKGHSVAQDWLSQDTVEPSRQALHDLIKQHSNSESTGSGSSPEYRARPRTNTVTSSFSLHARSLSDASNEMSSRPSSRQSFADGAMASTADHQESSSKSLLSRGTRLLKRQGSKLNLLSSQSSDVFNSGSDARIPEPSPTFRLQRQLTTSSKRKLTCKLGHGLTIDIALQVQL